MRKKNQNLYNQIDKACFILLQIQNNILKNHEVNIKGKIIKLHIAVIKVNITKRWVLQPTMP